MPLSVLPRALATSVAMAVVASVSVFGLAQPALAASTASTMTPATSAVASPTDTASTDYTAFVDPFVSTAGDDGNDMPGAQAPNGIAKVNPLTTPNRNHTGYDYNEDQIAGFTSTNLDGVGGSGGGGDLLVVPTGVTYTARPGTSTYAHDYSHDDETATPGYYQVGLGDITGTDGSVSKTGKTIDAQVAATTRTAVQQYAFPEGETPSLVLDLANNFTSRTGSSVEVSALGDGRVSLDGRIAGNFNGATYELFYYAETTQPATGVKTWGSNGSGTSTSQDGTDTGAILTFDAADASDIGFDITISPISAEQAKADQAAELGTGSTRLDLDEVRAQTQQVWNERLGKVDIGSSATSDPTGDLKALFYTHLYRMSAMPMNATSTDGTYKGVDGAVHTADDFTYYDGWSSWDDFRKYSVFAYVAPEMYRDMIQSLIYLFADTAATGSGLGSLTHSVPTVRWERSAVIIADALSKGYTGFDRLDEAYPALRDYTGYYTGEQLRQGYVSNDPGTSVQRGYDQWALAIVADALGRTDDAATLREQAALPIANLFKPGAWTASDGTSVGLLTPKDSSGAFGSVNYEQFESSGLYQGTLWQYNWYDAYDMAGLADAMGGTNATRLALEHMFGEDDPDNGHAMLHSNANEIDLQAPYLFNYVGEPSLTQKWVRSIYTGETWNRYIATGSTNEAPSGSGEFTPPIKTQVYKLDPKGFLPTMDNDAGTMSTMFVAAALGLFPVTAGSSQYQIGSPFFDSSSIHYTDGRTFTVKAQNVSPDSYYVQSATLNGAAFDNTWLDYSDVLAGGELDFTMGSNPSAWGSQSAPAYSLSTDTGETPATGYTVTAGATSIEAAADGTVDGAISLGLSQGASFAAAPGTSLVSSGAATVSGLPAGVTADVVVTDAQTVSIRLKGTASANAKFFVAFTDAAFENGVTASQVTGQGVSNVSPLALSVASGDRVALQQLVEEALLVRPGSYSYASYQTFLGALQRGQTAAADATATSARLRSALSALQTAAASLQLDEGAYRVLQGEASDEWSGGELKNEAYQSAGDLGGVTEGAWIRYNGLDFAGVTPKRIDIRYANSQPSTGAPSSVDVHAGGNDGPIVATVSLPGTDSWANYTTVSAEITDTQALMDAGKVTFVFHAPSGQQWVANFDWFQFAATDAAEPGDPGDAPTTVATLTAPNVTTTGNGFKPLNLGNGLFENVTNGAWAEWAGQDLGDGVDSVTVTYDKPQSRAATDGHIELSVGARDSATRVSIPLDYTGSGWGTYGTATVTLDPAVFSGTQDVYASFVSTTQTDALPYVANVKSLELTRSADVVSDVVIQTSSWVANSGGGLKAETSNWNDGTTVKNLGGTTNGSWLDYGDIDFGAVARTQVAVHYVNNSSRCGTDSQILVYLDDVDTNAFGTPYATIPLPVTGNGWSNAGTTTVTIPGITGTHRVHLVLKTTPDANHPYVANLDTLSFTTAGPGGDGDGGDGNGAADLTDLQAAVDATAALEGDEARYDSIDFAVFTRELAAARELLAAGTTKQDDVINQARGLRLAAGQLIPRVRLVLENLVDRASAVVDERYTDESWAALQSTLSAATLVAHEDASTDAELASAGTSLAAALAGLTVRAVTAPLAPAAVSATALRTSVTVEWTSPTDDGGSAVTGWIVTLSDGHEVRIDDPTQHSTVFTWLPVDTALRAHVAAVNAVGASPVSADTVEVTTSAAATAGSGTETGTDTDSADAPSIDAGIQALADSYASDSWPATPDGSNPFVWMLREQEQLPASTLAANETLPDTAPVTAENDAIEIAINSAASAAQVDKAEIDADNSATVTNYDGLGSQLGQIYRDALNSGKLPLTNALFGRVTQGLDNTDAAKNYYDYLRPYVRLGFVGDGGKIRESNNGGYSGLATSGSFPSGHTYGGYTAGTLLATLLPEMSPSILARASEYGDNRIVLGFHYPLDVMSSRMTAQATIAHRWADPSFQPLLEAAQAELQSVLIAGCEAAGYGSTLTACEGDAYDGLDETAAVDRYTQRLSYGFSQVGAAGQSIQVPAEAAALLTSSFPELDDAQRTSILAQTALDSGYPLDLTADGDASWQRLNLAAAMTAQYVLNADGTVTVTNHADQTAASVASASSLSVAGVAIDGFSPATRSYVVDWPAGAAAPAIAAIAASAGATVTVTEGSSTATSTGSAAGSLPSQTVTITSANGRFAQTYAVVFQVTADDHLPEGVDPGTIGDPGTPGTPGDGGSGEQPGTGGGSNPGTGAGSGPGAGTGSNGTAANGSGSGSADGDLASTGSNAGVIASIAALLLAIGALVIIERRRRRPASSEE